MPQNTEQHFRSVAPVYMRLLLTDFPEMGPEDAAAIFGNAGHESKGLTDDQEDAPVVRGSRGGLNWMQWTGPRRRAMEAYCARNKLDPASDIAAYKWLFLELKGDEKKAIPALLKATTLEAKVIAFEKAFLRAGVKHYPSRQQWAKIALEAFGDHAGNADTGAVPQPPVAPPVEEYEEPLAPAPVASGRPSWVAIAIILVLALLVGVSVFFGGQVSTGEEVSLFGPPQPHPRPFGILGGESNLFADIGMQIVLAFVAPLVSAAATAAVGWIGWQWSRVLKTDFDAKSAAALHAALERGILAAIDAFGPRASRANLLSGAADYVETFNPGAAKRLGRTKLEHLAVPHLVTAKAKTKR